MDSLGLIVILPIAAVAGWSIYTIYHWLKRLQVPASWWKKFIILALIGFGLGIWWAFFIKYQISNARLEGFPIPVGITTREKPGAEWMTSHLPLLIRVSGMITNLLGGIAISLAPMAIAAFFRENRTEPQCLKPPV